MAYSQELAGRVRRALSRRKGFSERKMFGGMCYLLNGNMCCGVLNDELILRLGAEGAEKILKRKHTRAFDFTGKPLRGFVMVEAAALGNDASLKGWIKLGADFAASLPPK